jgi:hypothetical protein
MPDFVLEGVIEDDVLALCPVIEPVPGLVEEHLLPASSVKQRLLDGRNLCRSRLITASNSARIFSKLSSRYEVNQNSAGS